MGCDKMSLTEEQKDVSFLQETLRDLCRSNLNILQAEIKNKPLPPSYTVSPGDTLYSVFKVNFKEYFGGESNIHKVDKKFQDADGERFWINDLQGATIHPGQKIYVEDGVLIMEALATPPASKTKKLTEKQHSVLFKTEIESTLNYSDKVLGGLSPEYRRILETKLTQLAQDPDCQDLSQKAFDKKATQFRLQVTRDMWQNLSGSEFKAKEKTLGVDLEEHLIYHLKLKPGLIGEKNANLDFCRTYKKEIATAAKKYQVPHDWIEDIIYIESKGYPLAVSDQDAFGIMQMKSSVYAGNGKPGILNYDATINPLNPLEAIDRGAEHLANLRTYFLENHNDLIGKNGLDEKTVIFQAYNAGANKIRQAINKHKKDYEKHLPYEAQKYASQADKFRDKQNQIIVAQR